MGQRDDLCQKAAVVKRARRDFRESPAQGPGRILGRRGGLEDALLRTEQPLGEQFGEGAGGRVVRLRSPAGTARSGG